MPNWLEECSFAPQSYNGCTIILFIIDHILTTRHAKIIPQLIIQSLYIIISELHALNFERLLLSLESSQSLDYAKYIDN